MRRLLPVLLVALAALAACGSDDGEPAPATATVSTTTTAPSPSATTTVPTTPQAAREIDYCATVPGSVPGTTFYTDGTTDWTQYCEDQYWAMNGPTSVSVPTAECNNGAVINEGGGNYSTCVNGSWNYVDPYFDPDSADGYGPNQPLPPACVRFNYEC